MRLNDLQQNRNADAAALQFPFYILQVGEGRVADIENDGVLLSEPISTYTEDIRIVYNRVFEEMAERHTDDEWLMRRAVFKTKNVHLKDINTISGPMISGTIREYQSANKVENEDESELGYPCGNVKHTHSGLGGYAVILLRNLDSDNGYCNVARYIVEDMTDDLLFLRLAIEFDSGLLLTPPRIPSGPEDYNFPVPGFTRRKVPVRVCFGLTTNKAQGQSFSSSLELDLREECFSHGQL